MDVISFRCAACQQVLKVGADKAGRKAKCKNCGKEVTIPAPSTAEKAPAAPATAAAPEPKSKTFDDDEDDDGAAYSFIEPPVPVEPRKPARSRDDDDEDEDDEEEEEDEKPKTEHRPRTRRKIRKKTVQFADEWMKFRIALMLVFSAMCALLLVWLLHTALVVIGLIEHPPYGAVVDRAVQEGGGEVRLASLAVGLLAGAENAEVGRGLFIAEQIISLIAGVALLGAFCVCLGVPNRFGTRGQAITLVVLSGMNLIVGTIFKLLPVLGAMSYMMVPLMAPEAVLNEANIDRVVPIPAFWCNAPFWEMFSTIIIQALYFFEPIFFCIFLRAAGMSLKDDEWLQPKAVLLLRLGFGQFFILLSFYLLSLTGSSAVLRIVLFVVYFLWRGFLVGYLICFALIAFQARARVQYLLVDENVDDENE